MTRLTRFDPAWPDTPARDLDELARERDTDRPRWPTGGFDDMDARAEWWDCIHAGLTTPPMREIVCETTVVEASVWTFATCPCGWRLEGDDWHAVVEAAEAHAPINPYCMTVGE